MTIDRPNCQCRVAATDVTTGQRTTAVVTTPVGSETIVGKFNEIERAQTGSSVMLPPSTFELVKKDVDSDIEGEQKKESQESSLVEFANANATKILQTGPLQDPSRDIIETSDSNRRFSVVSSEVATAAPMESKNESITEDIQAKTESKLAPVVVAEIEVAEIELPPAIEEEVAFDSDQSAVGEEVAATQSSPSDEAIEETLPTLPVPNEAELNTIFENNDAAEEQQLDDSGPDADLSAEPTIDPWTAEEPQPLASVLEESPTLPTEVDTATDPQPLRLTSPNNDEPVVLYARPTQHHTPARSRFENLKSEVTTDRVGSSMILSTFSGAKETQETVDDRFGLPTTDRVEFSSLPSIDDASSGEAVGLQREFENAQQMMLVVYRDEDGRLFLAPPATHVAPDSQRLAEQESNTVVSKGGDPIAPAKQYYLPPEPVLRLKATTPIGQPTRHPSVAKILMRDTVIVDGTHLLAMPELKTKKEHIGQLQADGSPSIDYEKLREAIRRLTPTNQGKLR